MIQIRRVSSRLHVGHVYEVDVRPHGMPRSYKRTRSPNWMLEPILGSGDAWSLVHEADRQWAAGNAKPVRFDEAALPKR